MDSVFTQRYSRQCSLPGFGPEGQQRLADASVLVVGAGGLGCPVLQYLAGAGVGRIGIVDGDNVSLENLHRQILYSEEDIGHPKVAAAANRVKALNSTVQVHPFPFRLIPVNAASLISSFDLVIDCTDDFATRYLIDDACMLLNIPLIHGSVHQYEGQVAFFDGSGKNTYRDLFPAAADNANVQDCTTGGILGTLTGIIGTVQASEAVLWIAHHASSLAGKVWTFDLRTLRSEIFELSSLQQTIRPRTLEELPFFDYDFPVPRPSSDAILLDVREEHEYGTHDEWTTGRELVRIPLAQLMHHKHLIPRDRQVAAFCTSGYRSRLAVQLLKDLLGYENVIAIRIPEHHETY